MGSLPLLLLALEALKYAPDSEPKLSLSLSLSSDLLPCSASVSNLFYRGVFPTLACAAGLMLVLSGALVGHGSPKDKWVGAPVRLHAGLNVILFKDSVMASVVAAIYRCRLAVAMSPLFRVVLPSFRPLPAAIVGWLLADVAPTVEEL
jgi:hypothetical protein